MIDLSSDDDNILGHLHLPTLGSANASVWVADYAGETHMESGGTIWVNRSLTNEKESYQSI